MTDTALDRARLDLLAFAALGDGETQRALRIAIARLEAAAREQEREDADAFWEPEVEHARLAGRLEQAERTFQVSEETGDTEEMIDFCGRERDRLRAEAAGEK